MLRLIFFNLLLFGVCGYALAKGTRDAKIIAATALIASFASLLQFNAYGSVETFVLAIDLVVLAVFIYVALTSDRFWPMWVAGFHVTTLFGHMLKFATSDLVPIAYAVSLRFWVYPQLIILGIAVWRSERRARGHDRTLLPSS